MLHLVYVNITLKEGASIEFRQGTTFFSLELYS